MATAAQLEQLATALLVSGARPPSPSWQPGRRPPHRHHHHPYAWHDARKHAEAPARDLALWFVVLSFFYEAATFAGLVAVVATNYYGVLDPEFVGATWPIISFGLASSTAIDTFYLVVVGSSLGGTLMWLAVFDDPAKHRGEPDVGCGRCRCPVALWAVRALLQVAQMAFLVALGSISVLDHETEHNAMGVGAAGCYLLHATITIPYEARRFLGERPWRPSELCRYGVSLEAAVAARALLAAFFVVSLVCFWGVQCSPVSTDSWWEYGMYGTFVLDRAFRVLDVALWPTSQPTAGGWLRKACCGLGGDL